MTRVRGRDPPRVPSPGTPAVPARGSVPTVVPRHAVPAACGSARHRVRVVRNDIVLTRRNFVRRETACRS